MVLLLYSRAMLLGNENLKLCLESEAEPDLVEEAKGVVRRMDEKLEDRLKSQEARMQATEDELKATEQQEKELEAIREGKAIPIPKFKTSMADPAAHVAKPEGPVLQFVPDDEREKPEPEVPPDSSEGAASRQLLVRENEVFRSLLVDYKQLMKDHVRSVEQELPRLLLLKKQLARPEASQE